MELPFAVADTSVHRDRNEHRHYSSRHHSSPEDHLHPPADAMGAGTIRTMIATPTTMAAASTGKTPGLVVKSGDSGAAATTTGASTLPMTNATNITRHANTNAIANTNHPSSRPLSSTTATTSTTPTTRSTSANASSIAYTAQTKTTANHPSMSQAISSSLAVTGHRVASVWSTLSPFTTTTTTTSTTTTTKPTLSSINPTTAQADHHHRRHHHHHHHHTTVSSSTAFVTEPPSDFTYVNVWEEDEEEILLLPSSSPSLLTTTTPSSTRAMTTNVPSPALLGNSPVMGCAVGQGDILNLLLQQEQQSTTNNNNMQTLTSLLEQANEAIQMAFQAKQSGELLKALQHHTMAAKLFFRAAGETQSKHATLSHSLLLVSQIQAKTAMALKRVVRLRPETLAAMQPTATNDRIRATVRGALDSPAQADISQSAFLGQIGGERPGGPTDTPLLITDSRQPTPLDACQKSSPNSTEPMPFSSTIPNNDNKAVNPVDEMLALERELRDMDMTLALGSSIASLDARSRNTKTLDGSFMVIPPIANSYMSSSSMWSQSIVTTPCRTVGGTSTTTTAVAMSSGPTSAITTGAPRNRPPNRIQNLVVTSTSRPYGQTKTPVHVPGLDATWWDTSTHNALGVTTTSPTGGMGASQMLTSSVASLASSVAHDISHPSPYHPQQQSANTKQLIRLMDSLKTLGDENAALLRQLEDAEAARIEARMAREEVRRFKEEYAVKFDALRDALRKFRTEYPNATNPVVTSEFVRNDSMAEKIQRHDQLIRKLTADLKKEKEEGKKKDAALRKYENFYREVKARSAQKAAQRQQEILDKKNIAGT